MANLLNLQQVTSNQLIRGLPSMHGFVPTIEWRWLGRINHQDQHIAILIHPRPSNLPLYPVISCEKKIHKMKILSKNHENKTDGLVMSECQVPKAWAAALPYPWPWKKVDTKEPQHFDKLPLLPFLWPAAGKYYIQGDNKVPIEARSTHSSTFQACRTRGCYNRGGTIPQLFWQI